MRPTIAISLVLKVSWLGLVLGAMTACPDTMGKFDEFIERSDPYRVLPAAGECTAPIDLSGSYLLGAAVVVDPAKPLRFKLDLTVDLSALTIDAVLQPIAVPPNNGATAPGTLVGEAYTTSASLDGTDGGFALDFGTIVVPAEANPILPAPVTANLVLEGCTSTPTSSCGAIQGDITAPVALPLAGSTWAIVPLPAGVDPMTVEYESACPEPE